MVSQGAEEEEEASGVLDVTRDPAIVTLAVAGVMSALVDIGSREKRRGRLGPWPGAGPAWVGLGRERKLGAGPPALLGPAEVKESFFFFSFFLKIHYIMNLVKFVTK
jgi:hypothetical protein